MAISFFAKVYTFRRKVQGSVRIVREKSTNLTDPDLFYGLAINLTAAETAHAVLRFFFLRP